MNHFPRRSAWSHMHSNPGVGCFTESEKNSMSAFFFCFFILFCLVEVLMVELRASCLLAGAIPLESLYQPFLHWLFLDTVSLSA
jgi:hypothetical protein